MKFGTERPSKEGPNSPTEKSTIDELVAQERKTTMVTWSQVVIRAQHLDSGMNCEFTLVEPTMKTIKEGLAQLKNEGFVRVAASSSSKPDLTGKSGTVINVEKVADKKQWKVSLKMHEEGLGTGMFIDFSEKFRVGDRVRLQKNDKGFYEGTIINNENLEGEKQTDIPF